MAENVEHNGPVVGCETGNLKVPGSTPGELPTEFEVETDANKNKDNEMPTLRPYDQTPITPGERRNTAKRPCTELSPINENELGTDLWKRIEATIVSSVNNAMNNAIPKIIENIVCELQCTFNTMIEHAVKEAKKEIIDNVGRDIEFVDTKSEMLARCEAEQLETYNRRDNVKILGLREDLNENGQPLGENLDQTMNKVLALTKTLGTSVDEKDISIAHRLPSRKGQVKPIIVRFSRRVAKVDVLRRKKILFEQGSDIRVFEDISRPRVMFLNMMKQDNRINSAYTRDGTIFYTKKDDNRVYKILNLYEGGLDLGYSLHDLKTCFRSY